MASLAFSTFGCPEASLEDVLALAACHGVSGLELRSGDGQLVHTALTAVERSALRATLEAAGLQVLSVASPQHWSVGPSPRLLLTPGCPPECFRNFTVPGPPSASAWQPTP